MRKVLQSWQFRLSVGAALTAVGLFPSVAGAQIPVPPRMAVNGPVASPSVVDMTMEERLALTQTLINRWSSAIQAAPGASVDMWRDRATSRMMKADAANLRAAAKGETYDAAMSALSGIRTDLTAAADTLGGSVAAPRLGDLNVDLTYTPITPCRILDTRLAGGVIPATGTRSFVAVGASSYASQGGSSTDCGTLGVQASAVAVNLTAVSPSGNGFTTVFRYNSTMPLSASLTYTPGAVLNNTVISPVPNPLQAFDISVYTFAESHYVGDIVGYFARPVATPLECVETSKATITIGVDVITSLFAPACPTGYTPMAMRCETPNFQDVILTAVTEATCRYANRLSTAQSISAWQKCCRVPGR